MFKKLLSSFTLMMLLCTLGTSAQNVQTKQLDAKAMCSFASTPATSVITPESNEFWWGYWDGNFDDDIRLLGVGQHTTVPQKYSACVRIPAGSVIGKDKTIEAIKFSFSDNKNVDDVKIWMSNELPVKIENATICCQNVAKETLTSVIKNGNQWNEVRFEKPYKIEDKKDVYVGYTFVITANEGQNDQYPLIVDMAGTTQENAMYLRFSEPSDWTDFKNSQNGDLAIRVLMSGNIQKNSVGITPDFEPIYAAKNADVELPIKVDNRGVEGFDNIDITVDIDGNKETKNIVADKKVTGMNQSYKFKLNLKALAESGTSNIKITVDKVNGQPNECNDNTMIGKIVTLTRAAQKKVLVEEFTAFWCGACPTGYVGLIKLRKQFGDGISLVSLHRNDPIECTDYVDFILGTNTVGYPNSHLDRTYMDVYPYVGSGKNGTEGKAGFGGFGLGNDVKALMKVLPVAELNVAATIEGSILTAKATTKFLYTGETNHALAFVVTEDGMQDEKWSQSNYLRDQKGLGWEDEEPLFDMWVNGEKQVKGVVYDDIAVAARDVYEGIEGSIPAKVTEETAYEYSVEFNLDEYSAIQDKTKLNIIAIIIDKTTGKIVNTDYKKIGEDTGIENIGTEEEAAEVARYTIDGRRITTPQSGINIVKYSDGTVKKVVVE